MTLKGRTLGKIKRKTKMRQLLVLTSNLNLVNNKIGTIEVVGRITIVEATIITTAMVVALLKAVIMIVTTISRILMISSTLIMTTPS